MRRRSRIDRKILDGFLTRETSFLSAAEVKALVGTMRITVEDLVGMLLPWAAEKAIVPLSKYKVGAVCRGNSGNLYVGANIEFTEQALHSTIHAEQSCVSNAMAHAEKGIRALAVTATPCGMCRQFLNELNAADELKIQILNRETTTLRDLLPSNFGPGDLDVQHRLLDSQSPELILDSDSENVLVQKALDAANQSYAPYSSSFAGVAIQTANGQVFTGSYIENAAYNPSLLPLQACLSNLIMAGRRFSEIDQVVLVHQNASLVNHPETAHFLLKSLTNVPLQIVSTS